MKIRCVIIDDEPLAAELLKQYAESIPYLQLEAVFHSAVEAIPFLSQQKPELVFLDINLPKLSGLELAGTLLGKQKVIFTTAYSEHAAKSYELNAVDYLVKPVTFDRFVRAVNKAVDLSTVSEEAQSIVALPQSEAPVFIKSGRTIIQLYYSQIIFIEGLKDYVQFATTEGRYTVYKRMKDLESMLPQQFVRVHNSFIVHTRHIRKVEDNQVYAGGEIIPVGEKYRTHFYELIGRQLL